MSSRKSPEELANELVARVDDLRHAPAIGNWGEWRAAARTKLAAAITADRAESRRLALEEARFQLLVAFNEQLADTELDEPEYSTLKEETETTIRDTLDALASQPAKEQAGG